MKPKPAAMQKGVLRLCAILLFPVSLFFSQRSAAQCGSIPVLTCATPVTATPSGVGVWNVTTCGFSTPGSERVYSFTPTTTGVHSLVVSAASGGYIDYFFKVASGGCNSTGWTCILDINSPLSVSMGTLTAGVQYYILLDPEGTGSYSHTFNIVCPATGPANNECATNIPLTSGSTCTTTAGTTVGATQSIPAITCASFTGTADDDVWYSFVAVTTIHTVTVVGGGTFDAVIDVRSGACNGSNIGCADATTSGGTEAVTLSSLSPGTTYYIRVYSYGSLVSNQGTFTICVTHTIDPCSGITTLACATPATITLNGAGGWNNNTCGFSTPGQEKVYSFTPTITGVHQLQVTSATGTGYIDYMYKAASGGCSSSGWTCIDDINFTTTTTIGTLTAGVQYYILLDAESTASSTQTFQINCPAPDPCTSITTIACATPATITLTGTGVWNNSTCLFSTPGNEKIYSFTPTVTGVHSLQVTSATGTGYIDYMYKAASGGCVSTGWTCIDDINFTTTVAIGTLTAGVQYYILLDAESTTSSTQTFQINCPAACVTNNWAGTTSNNWFTATNWSCGTVPGAATDVSIPSGTPNSPLITAGTAQVHNLTIQSSATLTNNGTLNINGGGVVVNNGTYKGTGAFTGALYNNNGGIVAPGNSPGCTSFGSGYTNGTGTEQIEIGGTTVCTQYDQLQVTGTATLSGTLDVILFGGFTPSCGQSFKIMTSTTLAGTFATLNFPALPAGLSWGIQYNLPNPGDVTLTVSGTPAAVATPSAQTICSGAAITTIVLNGSPVAGTTYNWTRDNAGTVTGIGASGSGDISGTLTNTTGAPVVVTFIITPTAGSCSGTPITATVLVNAAIADQTVTALPTSVCPGGSSTITVGASQPGINYTLRIDPANTFVAGPTASNGPAINFATGPIPVATTYNILAEADKYSVYLNGGEAGFIIPQASPLDVTDNFTIEGWIKPDNISAGFSRMFNKSQCYALGLSSGQSLITFTRHNSGDYSLAYPFVSGQWYHIACTYVGGTVEFFVNGVSIGTVSGVPGIITSGLGAQIGSESSSFHQFKGNIDNVRIWNSVRTQNEIANNRAAFLTSTGNPSLVANWWIIEGSGNAKDYSANAINATSLSGTWQTDAPTATCSAVLTNKPTVSMAASNTITLTSAAGTNAQTVCENTPITNITYSTTGATGATFSGLPAGVTGNWAANVVTISGTPTTAIGSPFSYTVTLTGGCASVVTATGTITVNPTPTVNTITNQVVCNGSSTAAISFSGTPPGAIYNWTNNTPSIGLAANGTGNIASFVATNATNAPVTATITVTPVAGQIPGYAYVTNSFSNTVSVIDIATNTVVTTVPVGAAPFGIAFNSDKSKAYIVNGNSGNATIINTATNTTGGSFAAGADPRLVAFNPSNNRLYVTNITAAQTTVVDATTNAIIGTIPVQTFPIGVAVSPDGTKVYVVNAVSGTLSVCDAATNTVITNIGTGGAAQQVAVSPDGTRAYVTNAGPNSVSVINTITNTVITNVGVSNSPTGVAVTPDGSKVYVGALNGSVTVINTATNTVIATIPGISSPDGVAVTADGSKVYVTGYNGDNVAVIDVATNTIITTIPVGDGPGFVAIKDPVGVACPGTPTTFTITVNPTPNAVATPASQAICTGSAIATIALTGNVPGTVFNWTRDNTGTVTGIAASGSGDISGSLTNTTNTPVTVTFTITPSNTIGAVTCTGTPITATVVVNPMPILRQTYNGVQVTANNNGTDDNGSFTVCSSSNPNLFLTEITDVSGITPSNKVKVQQLVTPTNVTHNLAASGTFVLSTIGPIPLSRTVTLITPTLSGTLEIRRRAFFDDNLNNIIDANECVGDWVVYTVTVNPVPDAVATPSSQTVCSASPITTIVLSGSLSGTVFNWTRDNTGTVTGIAASGSGDISGTLFNTTISPVTVTFTIIPEYTNAGVTCTGTAITATVVVNQCCPTIPTLTTNPTPTVCDGTNVTFTASGLTNMAAGPYGIIFKYFAAPTATPYTGGTVIATVPFGSLTSGGTVATASSAALPPGTHNVYAILTPTPADPLCRPSATTTLNVNPIPDVVQPSNQVVCNNTATTAVNFSGAVSGTNFDWTNNTPSIGLAASGTGNIASFTATNATNAPVVATVTVTPSTGGGGGGGSTAITMPPQTSTNAPNVRGYWFTAPVNFTITSLFVPTDASSGNQSIAVLKFDGNTPPPVFSGTTNAFTTLFVTQNDATAGNIAVSIPVSAGEVIGILGYRGTTNSYGNGSSGITIAGNPVATTRMGMQFPLTTTLPQDIWQEPSSTNISRVIFEYSTGGPVCTGSPKTFTYTVNPTPTVNAVANQTVCNGTSTTAVTFTGFVPGTVYNWTNNTPSIGLAASGSGNISSFVGTNATNAPVTATITVTPSYTNAGVTCNGTPTTFTITVNPTATINAVANQVVCNNAATAAVNFSSPTTGGTIVYNWTNNNTTIGLGASGSGNIASFTATNSGTAPVTATITVTPTYTNGVSCVGTPITFTITVNPTATVNTVANQTICNGANTTAVNFSSPTTGGTIVYNWTNNNTTIGLGASGSGNIASFVGTNSTNAPVTATITVIPTYTNVVSCVGTPITFTITVNPTATVNTVANQNLCNGASTTAITFSSPTTGGTIVYNWTNNTPSIGLGASGSGNIASFATTNATNAPVTATITVTPTYTNGVSCVGTPRTFTITVYPTPQVNQPANQVICNNTSTAPVNFTSPTTGSTIVYNWINNTTSIGLAASGSGNIASFTGTNATNAPVTATITVTPSNSANNALTFNGTTQQVNVNPAPTIPIGNSPYTIEAWVKPNSVSGANGIVGWGNWSNTNQVNAFRFNGPTTLINYWWSNDLIVGIPNVLDGNWHHVVATFDGTTRSIYFDGVLRGSDNPTGHNIPFATNMTIARTCPFCGPGEFLDGNIDEMRIWNVGKTQAQILASMGSTVASNSPGLAAYYRLDEGSGSLTADLTGNGNNGALINGPAWMVPSTAPISNTVCTGPPKTFTITVNPTATVNAVANQTVCNGANTAAVNFSSPTTGGTIVYNWTNNNTTIGLGASGSGNIASFVGTNSTNAPVTATITVTPSYTNGGVTCIGTAITFTITVNPTATVNAVANQVVCNNTATAAVNFSSPTTGGTIVYNWTNNTPSIGLAASGSGNIPTFVGTNASNAPVTATITVTPTYTNVVSCVGTPRTFTITVNPTPIVNPVANQIVCNNTLTTANFSSPTTGGTLVYNWTNTNTAIGLGASGSGNISFTSTNTTPDPITGTITVTPSYTNAGVTCVGAPITFTITVNPTVVLNPVPNQVVCNGAGTAAVNFTTATSIGTVVYNWTNTNTAIGLGASGTGNIASFVATNTTNAPITASITVTPTYINVISCVGTPLTFTITVNPTATVNAVANQIICNGGNTTAVNFSSPTTGGTIVYNWTNNAPSIGLASSGSGNIASFVATNITNAPVVATITVTPAYTNGGTTCNGTPITFTITVNPTATINMVANQAVCNGSGTAAINFSSPTTGGTIVYNWTNNTPSIGLAANGTGNIPSFVATNATNAPVVATISVSPTYTNGVSCTGTSINFTITVNPTATVNAVANQVVCNNTFTTAINFSSPTTGGTITYNWTNNAPTIGLASSGSGNIAAFLATNTTNAPITATITVTPAYSNGVICNGTPRTFTIIVNPTAIVNPVTSQTTCNASSTTAVNFSSPTTGGSIVYNWTNSAPSIGLAASGTGNIPAFTALNPSNAPVTATIVVTPSYTNAGVTCVGTPLTFTIIVNPTATVTAIPGQVVCNGTGTAPINFTSPTTGGTIVFTWVNNNTSIGLAANGTGDIASFIATNPGNTPVTATIVVTPSYTNGGLTCDGVSLTFTITVNPTPNATATPSSQTVCSTSPMTPIALTGTVPGTVFTWTRDNTTNVTGIALSGTGNISGAPINITGVSQTVIFTITPRYTNAGVTCTGTPITATVIVPPALTIVCPANIVVNAAPGTCAATVTFAATVVGNPTPTVTYSQASGSSFPVGTTVVTVTATNICGTVSCSFTVTVVDVRAPVITTHPVNQTVCQNSTATFSVVSTFATSYQWQTYNGLGWVNIPGATSATLTIPNVPLNLHLSLYRVQVTGPCATVVTSEFVTLRVNALPTIQLTTTIDPPFLLPGQTLSIIATGIQPGGVFVWKKNGVVIPGATTATLPGITAFDIGVYEATYTDANGCTSLPATITIRAKESINFYVYPNPNNGKFHIRFYNQANERITIQVFNSAGGLVFQRSYTAGPLAYSVIDIDLGNRLPDGSYMVSLINAQGKPAGSQVIIVHRNP